MRKFISFKPLFPEGKKRRPGNETICDILNKFFSCANCKVAFGLNNCAFTYHERGEDKRGKDASLIIQINDK